MPEIIETNQEILVDNKNKEVVQTLLQSLKGFSLKEVKTIVYSLLSEAEKSAIVK